MTGLAQYLRRGLVVAGVASLMGAAVIVSGLLVSQPRDAGAQVELPYCEDDACVKIERWWWFGSFECRDTPGTGSGCEIIGDGCRSYDCGLH